MRRERLCLCAALAAGVLWNLCGCAPVLSPQDAYQAVTGARSTLQEEARHSDAYVRAQAVEALARTQKEQAAEVFLKALQDGDPVVRFAGAMAIGELRYAPAKDTLLEMAKVAEGAERDKRVFCAVIYALHRLGDDTHTGQLGGLLFDKEKQVRANAAMIMGKMGERAGIEPLRILESDERDGDTWVRINALEALAVLGDQRSVGYLEGFSKWHALDSRLVAIHALAEAASHRSRPALIGLLDDPLPRVRVAAAGALARLGYVTDKTYNLCRKAADSPDSLLKKSPEGLPASDADAASLQELACKALGDMARPLACRSLQPLLGSSSPSVRVAAAMAILKLLPGQQLQQPEAAQ